MAQKISNRTKLPEEDLRALKKDLKSLTNFVRDLRYTRLNTEGPLLIVALPPVDGRLAANVVRPSGPDQEEKVLLEIRPSEEGECMRVKVVSPEDFHIDRLMRFVPVTPWFYRAEEMKMSSQACLGNKSKVRIPVRH